MKLLYISCLYPPDIVGGAELVLETQAKTMAARGHDVTVLVIGAGLDITTDIEDNVTVIRAPSRNRYPLQLRPSSSLEKALWHFNDRDNSKAGKLAREIISGIMPDIACCHNITGWSISLWRELKALGIPIVQVLHDQYLMCMTSIMFRSGKNCTTQCLDCKLLRRGHARASNQVTAVVGVSRYVLDKLVTAGYFSSARIQTVLNNVSTGQLPAGAGRRAKGKDIIIGYIGGLTESKGVRYLLETIKRSDLSGIRVLVGGRGEAAYEKSLRAEYADDRIEFLGYTTKERFFNSVDLTVVPSLWNDTFPSVVFESLGFGVPLVASRRGGIPEMIIEGETGFLFDPNDEGSLLSVLSNVLQSPDFLSGMYDACRARAGKYYDMDAWANAQERIFRDTLTLQ